MKKIIIIILLSIAVRDNLYSQYADLGTGNLKDKIWWFDWNGFTIANGASRTFNTADGLSVTITFSNVLGPICQPTTMNTWSGAVLHFLYNFSNTNIKPALYSPNTSQNIAFTLGITATRNGLPVSFKFIAADAEASGFGETINLVTNGGNWSCIDFFRNSSQTTNPFAGCNTTSATLSETYGLAANTGQNPVIASDAPNSGALTVSCSFNWPNVPGHSGLAFGIFAPVDRGDLPPGFGYAQHRLEYSGVNQCNYLPPLPGLVQSQTLKIGTIAGDADGAESLNDNTTGADEDGVNSFPFYTNTGSYSLTVALSNTTGNNTYLTGWFDYNRNGVFENNEFVTNTIPNNATSSVLTWAGLPVTLPTGTSTACAFRLRLSSDIASTQNPAGFAINGEVEDYFETITQNISVANFTLPDTVCVNTPVTITNTSTNATTSYWNFCVANINSTPAATNLGNIGNQFQLPVFIDYTQYNGNYYGFVTNNTPGKLTRLDFGNSLLNTPVAVNLGNVGGIIPNAAEEIQLAFNEGKWYAIIVGGNAITGGSRIVKIDFGPDLTNTSPTGTNWGNIGGLNYPGPLHLFNDNGNWYAFTVDAGNSVIRFSFGSSFQNPPTAVNFGNVGGLISTPDGINVISDNGEWYAFITNRTNSIIRLDFGNSLLNTPTAVNLGNPNNTLNFPRDIYVMKFCNELVGFVVNEGSNDIVKLNFANLTSVPSAISLGNIGSLSFPHSLSKIFRVGADLYSFILNVNNNTLTRLNFTGCTNSSIPNYSGTTPPPVTYTTPGTYNINLTIDDGLPTQSSICKQVVILGRPDIDFNYVINTCNPLTVQFNGIGNDTQNPYWSFGDATTNAGNLNPIHTYLSQNNYTVMYTAGNTGCPDTVIKTISLSVLPDNIIITPDTTICFGAVKQLRTVPALSFCWSPATYLSDPNSPNPITSTPQTITYHYTAEVTGNNLITNGDFSSGNSGFTSDYNFANPNVTEGQYFVGSNPQAWNGGLSACADHTTGNGNMMLINGSPAPDLSVWKQTVSVAPNTNYAFSTWIQSLWTPNPAQLQFSINGKDAGTLITASLPTCTWTRFYTTWNSGNNTSAVISIVNKNTAVQGNDFALDDISFAPVIIKRDSVKITVDTAIVRTNNDVAGCEGIQVQLNTTGASTYSWSPATGLSNAGIANPVASPSISTEYFVTGTTTNGCTAKDTVNITIYPKPVITKSANDTICKNTSVQLFAGGGGTYAWTPGGTLNNPIIPNPIATPLTNTTYYLTVTNANTCTNTDSIKISIHPDPVFSISPPAGICEEETIQLTAAGGDIYVWQPASSLSSLTIANPVASPLTTTSYSVNITETACNNSTTLSTTITVNSLPVIQASKANDIDCSNDRSQLNATGAQTYLWSPSASLSNPAIANPVATPLSNTQYVVKGTDASGCSNYDSVTVNFLAVNTSGYLMPTAFTPNNDGLNDCYGIRYWGVIQELEFSVYNRWGQRIFFTKNPTGCWDGLYKGVMQDIGVYIFMIKAKTLCGDTFQKGFFTLVR